MLVSCNAFGGPVGGRCQLRALPAIRPLAQNPRRAFQQGQKGLVMPKTALSRGLIHRLRLVALLAFALSLLSPPDALAALDWSVATKVSQRDGEGSYEPAVAVDSQGFVHLVWYGGETADKWRVFYTNNRSGRFSTPRRISEDSGEHKDVDIAVGSDGHVHVIATRRLDFESEVVYFESPNYGQVWPIDDPNDAYRIRNISNSSANGVEGALALDPANNVYFVWADNRTGDYRIRYTVRVNGVFGETGEVSPGTQTRHVNPDLVVTTSGENRLVHVVFNSRPARGRDADDRVFYALGLLTPSDLSRGRFAVVFNPARQLTFGEENTSQNPALATDGGNNLFLAYEYVDVTDRGARDRNTYFQISNSAGASWSPQQRLTLAADTSSAYAAIAYGRASGRPVVTIAWQEFRSTSSPLIYALEYFPDTNQYSPEGQVLISGAVREGSRVALGGHPTADVVAATFQALDGTANRKVYYASRAVGLSATPTINDGAAFTKDPQLNVELAKVGLPSKLRYAVDRDPTASDPAVDFPASNSFTVTAPASERCERTVSIQVSGDGVNFTNPTRDSIIVDTAVQATLEVSNPAAGDPRFTRTQTALVRVRPQAECTGLASTAPALAPDGAGGFSGILPLSNGPQGTRELSVTVTDEAGNSLQATGQITVDTTAPVFVAGNLSAPTGPLSRTVADLTLTGLQVTDNAFPGGLWGVEVANTLDASADDDALVWTPRQALRQPDGTIVVRDWTVATGLGRPLGDPTLANTPIEVRVRFIDGAGNPTNTVLDVTVTLVEGYSTAQALAPLLLRN
jgi:hypothetical protein